MSQYDKIAKDYQQASHHLMIFEVIGYSLLQRVGDLRGKSVLDLACGEGFLTRRIKQLGAGRTVGADIPSEMMALIFLSATTRKTIISSWP